tara:strand:- start:9039 stop:10679 length:1641 start_codon:yes stop_codon:yes gene_type:complete
MLNDGHHLATGYATYGKEVLSRLAATNKFELAELACFTDVKQAAAFNKQVPWAVYPNSVHDTDPRHQIFKSNPANSFGRWRFEHVCLDFKPDIVWDIRDYWMLAFSDMSPYRDLFHWAIMPTVDSAPQNEAWLETFINADSVLTYTDWGGDVLKDQCKDLINYCGSASPGVDLDVYKPAPNKAEHKKKFGLDGNINIIGTVMRNQKRKLYPDLFRSFAEYIEICMDNGREDLAKSTYLYVHTGYPDLGWSIPSLLKEHGVTHKVLFTYICHTCGHYFPSFFQDARTVCPRCSSVSALTPSTARGLSREQLANIYNLFDCYIQYSICEGFGMPQVEALACGLPLFTVDYSAMGEVGRKGGGELLKVGKKFLELETGAYRVYPDNSYTAERFFEFLSLPQPIRARKGFHARQAAEKFYNWDTIAKVWEQHFESVELTGNQGEWDSECDIHNPLTEYLDVYDNMTNEQFVGFLFKQVLNKPEKQYSHMAMNALRSLNYGLQMTANKMVPFTRQQLFEQFSGMAQNIAIAENHRKFSDGSSQEDYIKVAH